MEVDHPNNRYPVKTILDFLRSIVELLPPNEWFLDSRYLSAGLSNLKPVTICLGKERES
jgi:hypothetical protein